VVLRPVTAMTSKLDLFVDEMLDDVVQEWMRERDFDPAWWRNECAQPWVRQGILRDCARYGAAVQRNAAVTTQSRLRGQCREQQFVRNLCMGRVARDARGRIVRTPRAQWAQAAQQIAGRDIRRGVRVVPRSTQGQVRRSPIVDAVFGPLGPMGASLPAGAAAALEHKSMWVPRYVDPMTGRIDRRALRDRVLRDAGQVHRQQRWARIPEAAPGRPRVRPGLPTENELVYTLDGLANLPPSALRAVQGIIRGAASQTGIRAHVLAMSN
jgi:hypothetical protein